MDVRDEARDKDSRVSATSSLAMKFLILTVSRQGGSLERAVRKRTFNSQTIVWFMLADRKGLSAPRFSLSEPMLGCEADER